MITPEEHAPESAGLPWNVGEGADLDEKGGGDRDDDRPPIA
jgi:hypothetical protein